MAENAHNSNIKQIVRNGSVIIALTSLVILLILVTQPIDTKAVDLVRSFLPIVIGGNASTMHGEYVVIGWNDLGMHCYDLDYSVMSVLPPYNTIWAQVIRRGDPPEIMSGGISIEYSFPNNTYSVGKTNFWDYANNLFGVNLPADIGLAGKGLSGEMDPKDGYFIAEGIPLTEFSDSAPAQPEYLQVAHLVARDQSGEEIANSDVVAPVSSEMRCDTCHNSPNPSNFRMNILEKHDEDKGTNLAAQALGGDPVLCADCHADPALGLPGTEGIPSLSAAMHDEHKEVTSDCYACHPGPQTQCLRGTMQNDYGMKCVDCHVGGMQALGEEDRIPWHDEPRCGDCHDTAYAEQPDTLYRFSKGHGEMYCESCHNSTHAILPSREAADNLQSLALQGFSGTIQECTVCHLSNPDTGGPHK